MRAALLGGLGDRRPRGQGDGPVRLGCRLPRSGIAPAITADFDDAFSGTGDVRYKAMPYSRPIHVELQRGGDAGLGATEAVKVTIDGSVRFTRVGDPKNVNKVATLLKGELEAIFGRLGDDASPLSDGEPDVILIPGLPSGNVTLDVTGTVKGSSSHLLATAAAGAPLLASGKGRATDGVPFELGVTPTAAGKALLGAAHPALQATLTIRFDPSGPDKPVTVTRTGTLPART
jgi:hypothetical protein